VSSRHHSSHVLGAAPLRFAIAVGWLVAVAAPLSAQPTPESGPPKVDPKSADWEREPGGTYEPIFLNDPGAQAAAPKIAPAVDAMSRDELITDPVQLSLSLPTGLQTFDGSPLVDTSREEGDAAGRTVSQRFSDALMWGIKNVPSTQGTRRTVTKGGGTAIASSLDPVEPISGELVIEETDLELPSSGIPFRLVRTYRSRTDYEGPLGPVWDHSYNQRLFSVEQDAGATPTSALPPTRLPVEDDPILRGPSCGPVVALTTGSATTILFREIARIDGAITYASEADQLTLAGREIHDVILWTLTSAFGDVRHFDQHGRLVRWVDSNGLGLALAWSASEPSVLETVTDAEGRVVDLVYDAAGRIERIHEAASGLVAMYSYGADGALENATRSDGRSERYEYDYDASRVRGKWVAEEQLRPACEAACAPMDAPACTGGGACDAAVAEATTECLASCEPCAVECRSACPAACGSTCAAAATGGCEEACESVDSQENLRDACREAYRDLEPKYAAPAAFPYTPPEYCYGCDEACGDAFNATQCEGIAGFGVDTDGVPFSFGFSVNCETSGSDCCSTGGGSCAPTSCNEGRTCYETCKAAFLGFGDEVSSCDPPGTPPWCDPESPTCEWGMDATEWSTRAGCLARATTRCATECVSLAVDGGIYGADEDGFLWMLGCRAPCVEDCGETCDAACRRDDCPAACAELDLAGQCESSCVDGCIDEGHAAGPSAGPEYGHDTDLNFNIVAVYDGAGRKYLANTYGTDLGSPDFDSIIHQDFGGTGPDLGHLARRDLVAEADPMLPRPAPAWTDAYVDGRAEFETVQICPFTCSRDLTPPDDLFVPVGDVVLAFLDAEEPTLVEGYPVDVTASQPVYPTLVTFALENGKVVGRIERRGSRTTPTSR
jgi:YD repeat-containing protein